MLYNVLIVEDHPFQYEYLLNLFKEFGDVRVEAACDGHSALKRLDEADFDLVLTDLVMPGMDGVQFIQQLASRTLKPVLAIMSSASQRMIISASLVAQSLGLKVIGQLSKPVLSGSVHKLMKELDTWLGASRTPDVSLPVFSREMLQEALAAEVLQAWFQPKKSLANGRIISAEALARWPHPQHGLLMPADFLPAVVRFGLEEPLLMLFVKQTILAQSCWRKQGYDIPVSINLPTHLLDSDSLADRLFDLVIEHDGVPGMIGFELMECSTTDNISKFYAGACRLRMKGFGLAQDDFGQGYSSYFNLVSTPFTELKIDRALVQGCVENKSLALAIASIVALGQQLGLEVVAEGVESQDELVLLRQLKCDAVQGFLISQAVSSDQFNTLLSEDGPPTSH